jgi:hypothetical protein
MEINTWQVDPSQMVFIDAKALKKKLKEDLCKEHLRVFCALRNPLLVKMEGTSTQLRMILRLNFRIWKNRISELHSVVAVPGVPGELRRIQTLPH